jgi:hypothetical protein
VTIRFTATAGALIAALILVPPALALASLGAPGAGLVADAAGTAVLAVPAMFAAELVAAFARAIIRRS